MTQSDQLDISTELPFRTALIVDDHPLFCDALCMTVKAVANVEETRTAATLDDALTGLGAGDLPDLQSTAARHWLSSPGRCGT